MPTDPGFAGFHPDGFRFFQELHRDNSKAFWEANKHRYLEHVRAPLEALARELEGAFGEWHVYRPYRDLRFTKDKRPYKERASLQFGGRGPGAVGGQYLQIGAEGLFLGVGTYWMDGEQLKAYRRAVADDRLGAARLRVTITAHPPDRRRRDIANSEKAAIDALVFAGVIHDD